MRKIILLALSVIMIMLTACSFNKTSKHESITETISEVSAEDPETISKEIIVKTDNNSANDLIYESALKKIWIIKNTDSFIPSIYITRIENGIIEGKWSLLNTILPDCYTESFEPLITYSSFEGTIDSRYARCEFSDETGTGTFDLLLQENDIIEANIKFTQKTYTNKEYPEGSYIFEPYKIGDFGKLDSDKIRSYPVNLNSWGKVNLTTRYINAQHPYSAAYLTDDDNNILYEFRGLTHGWEIGDVSIEDVNDDGLKDIIIKLDSPVELIYIFIQMENGLFYDSKLDPEFNDIYTKYISGKDIIESGINNAYFFPDDVHTVNYNADIMSYTSYKDIVTFQIDIEKEFSDGKLYSIKLSDMVDENEIYNRLDMMYFYVKNDEIYKIDKSDSDKIKNGVIPDNSKLVFSDENYSEKENGEHYCIEINENTCEYHFWNDSVESGYYEKMTWQKGKGLIYYQSGYGAGRQNMTLQYTE